MTERIYFATEAYMQHLGGQADRAFDYTRPLANGEWPEWQRAFRERLTDLTGLSRIREQNRGLPLLPRCTETAEFPGYRREKWYIQVEPGVESAFYLLLPETSKPPLPLVLTPHGHGKRGKEVYVGNYEDEKEREESLAGERDVALQAVQEGYAVIAMDVRGFWEMGREEDLLAGKKSSCDELQRRAYMYGRTLIGERVYDMGRLIDYAATRPEIDTGRIAITGNSGGGTVSFFTGALDERISVCVPSAYYSTFRGSIMHVPHCLCNFIPGMMDLGEMYDISGLIAPRPALFVNGMEDRIFPIESAREAFAHTQAIYNAIDGPNSDRCELYEGNGGHRYYKKRVWSFIQKHFGDC
ncbi:hypothetical protein B1748_09005 [Paenibacillus sp. MY03]|uniref:alpha/beta hydrolase family protein n=1 Tax=Paenibacillus sp. MY03 TaxID=302980 RepID=UPI000B3C9B53|nr:alpha/beta hydrolase family protein [Paenibacillus sp. MY03]OUS77270.1 hypothetical protein B1748_09005 [Paenibacillus sp. MY03]